MVCSVPGPDGLQTHFDQLREYTYRHHNMINMATRVVHYMHSKINHIRQSSTICQLDYCHCMPHKREIEFRYPASLCMFVFMNAKHESEFIFRIFWGDAGELTGRGSLQLLDHSLFVCLYLNSSTVTKVINSPVGHLGFLFMPQPWYLWQLPSTFSCCGFIHY